MNEIERFLRFFFWIFEAFWVSYGYLLEMFALFGEFIKILNGRSIFKFLS